MHKSQNLFVRSKHKNNFLILGFLVLIFVWSLFPAHAHHPWEGQTETFSIVQGFLSGVAHPVFGIDHLLFLLSIGLVVRESVLLNVPILLGFGLGGSMLSQFLPIFPGSELLMGLSIILAALVAFGTLPPTLMLILIFCHGFVLGNSMIGVESTPLIGYFLGLLAVQTLVIFFGRYVFKHFSKYRHAFSIILLGAGFALATNTVF